VKPGNFVGLHVNQINLGGIKVVSTTFGKLDLQTISTFFNYGIKIGIPFLNKFLDVAIIPIPTDLFGLFKLSDLELRYHDGYLEAGLTPTFKPVGYKAFVPELSTEVFEHPIEIIYDSAYEEQDDDIVIPDEDEFKKFVENVVKDMMDRAKEDPDKQGFTLQDFFMNPMVMEIPFEDDEPQHFLI